MRHGNLNHDAFWNTIRLVYIPEILNWMAFKEHQKRKKDAEDDRYGYDDIKDPAMPSLRSDS